MTTTPRRSSEGPAISVRPATLADVEAVASMVAAAFATDPAWSFIVGPGNVAAKAEFARALLIPRIQRGTAWVTDGCTAVAMWDRVAEEAEANEDYDARWSAFRAEAGEDSWLRLQAYDAALTAVGPGRPHWYLGVLATHPDQHGRGLASAVLGPGLTAADADGWDCWLETSTTGNKEFYARRGFTTAIPVDIPSGPQTWWLRRPAGSDQRGRIR